MTTLLKIAKVLLYMAASLFGILAFLCAFKVLSGQDNDWLLLDRDLIVIRADKLPRARYEVWSGDKCVPMTREELRKRLEGE